MEKIQHEFLANVEWKLKPLKPYVEYRIVAPMEFNSFGVYSLLTGINYLTGRDYHECDSNIIKNTPKWLNFLLQGKKLYLFNAGVSIRLSLNKPESELDTMDWKATIRFDNKNKYMSMGDRFKIEQNGKS